MVSLLTFTRWLAQVRQGKHFTYIDFFEVEIDVLHTIMFIIRITISIRFISSALVLRFHLSLKNLFHRLLDCISQHLIDFVTIDGLLLFPLTFLFVTFSSRLSFIHSFHSTRLFFHDFAIARGVAARAMEHARPAGGDLDPGPPRPGSGTNWGGWPSRRSPRPMAGA